MCVCLRASLFLYPLPTAVFSSFVSGVAAAASMRRVQPSNIVANCFWCWLVLPFSSQFFCFSLSPRFFPELIFFDKELFSGMCVSVCVCMSVFAPCSVCFSSCSTLLCVSSFLLTLRRSRGYFIFSSFLFISAAARYNHK